MNPTVGDIAGNERRIVAEIERAAEAGAQLVLFPELAVTGYPPEDLLLKEHFLMDARGALERIAQRTPEIVALVGFPERAEDVYNACAVLADGDVQAVYRKVFLPNYGVFDAAGNYYVTDSGNFGKRNGRLLRIRPDHTTEVLAAPLGYANGLALSADERTLYMVESDTDSVLRFSIEAHGAVGAPKVHATACGRFPDGLTLDAEGNL